MSVENTNKKGTQEGGSQKGREKVDWRFDTEWAPQIWLSTIFDRTCLIKQEITLGVRVTITNNGFMCPFRLNRILNLTDIMLSTFAYPNLTTVFISHHFCFPSHMTLQNTFEANRWSWRPYLFILGSFFSSTIKFLDDPNNILK